MKLICYLFGHKSWKHINDAGYKICRRCDCHEFYDVHEWKNKGFVQIIWRYKIKTTMENDIFYPLKVAAGIIIFIWLGSIFMFFHIDEYNKQMVDDKDRSFKIWSSILAMFIVNVISWILAVGMVKELVI